MGEVSELSTEVSEVPLLETDEKDESIDDRESVDDRGSIIERNDMFHLVLFVALDVKGKTIGA